MRVEYHRTLVSDRIRNAAFWNALKAVIRPGETVVADIGAGTGLLGMMAARLGAKEVYLYEAAEVAVLARELLAHNKVRNCVLFPCHSTEMQSPPRADVVVSETLGNYPLEEDIVATLKDARRRHLKPRGIVIPRRVRQHVSAVVTDRFQRELTTWDDVGFGLDFAPARRMGLNNIYVRTFRHADLFDDGRASVEWDAIELGGGEASARRGEATFTATAPVTVHGFATWWTAELADGVDLSTAPEAPRTHWEQLYMPLLTPIALKSRESVQIGLKSRTTPEAGTTLAWTAKHLDARGGQLSRQALDLEKGYLP